MAGSPATRSGALPATLLLLLLLALCGRLHATEPAAAAAAPADAEAGPGPRPAQAIQPTRQSIYQHLTEELKAALGAEEHIRAVFADVAQGLRLSVLESVVPGLQALVDGVVERAEDAWVAADEAGRTLSVKPCVDGAEGDAQQVARRALEKAEGCVRAVQEEGELRVREAARLLNEIEDASKRFVTALEACVKEEEAKEAAAPPPPPPPPPAADVAAPEAAEDCPAAEQTLARSDASTAADGDQPKCKECACKKSAGGESPKEQSGEEDAAREESAVEDAAQEESGAKDAQLSDEQVGKYEQKGKKGKEWKDSKGKDKVGKSKKDNAKLDEAVDEKVQAKGKDGGKEKGKYKKTKDSEASKGGERTVKKVRDSEPSQNSQAEESGAERKDKKGKKSDKKESKGKKEGGEGKKGRQKRDLLAVNEAPEAAADPWPSEGATAEERHVIACVRSLSVKPLVDQKTRAYQRLQAVLQRTDAKRQDAPACVADHVRKAELKIAAVQQRMASCAERQMRGEL